MAVIMSKQLQVPTYSGSGGSGGGSVSGTLGSDLAVGSSVFLNVNGTLTEFLIVHQGKPSSLYDDSCDGIWLLMKDVYVTIAWDSSSPRNNDYQNSSIHNYLNGNFLALFDADTQSAIKQVKIPYVAGNGSTGSVVSGSNGLSTQIFLLSGCEAGDSTNGTSHTNLPVDGSKLDYFSESNTTRIAYMDGTATSWWYRTPEMEDTNYAYCADRNGNTSNNLTDCSSSILGWSGARPALILPSNAVFDPDTMEFIGIGTSSGGSGSGGSGSDITYTVNITGSSTSSYVEIDGTQYNSDAEVSVAKGTVISVSSLFVYLNGEDVAPTDGSAYKYTVYSDVSFTIEQYAITITL